MKIITMLSLSVLTVSMATTSFAQRQTFQVNPDASKVSFALGGSGHRVDGTFHVQSGSINFDTASPSLSGLIVVAAGSGNSGEPSRDKKMNADVLNSAQFAEISFAPKNYQGTLAKSGDSTLQVSGTFTLHGTPHEMTVPMQIHIDGGNMTANGHFVVPYVQWGLKDPSIFILKVAKQVDIDLSLSGNVAAIH